jgi:hydroxymethylpyrimidine pyrophosphatase-like HAD family hydrolase
MFHDPVKEHSQDRPPQGWSDLHSHLSAVRAADLLVVSDMTGTLITQTADSMLPKMREAQRSLFERGMNLILATADSGHSVQEFYLGPLGPVQNDSLYVVHSVGAGRGKVQDGNLLAVSHGGDLSLDDRQALLAGMDRALTTVLGRQGCVFSKEERDSLIESGARAALSSVSEKFGAQSFIEIIPSKAAIFFLEQKIAGPLQQAIFDAYLEDLDVQKVIRNGYRMIRGGNYVDVFTCSKEEGVRELMASISPIEKRTLMVLGDSENDLGILSDPYEGFDKVLRVFVGQSHEVVESMKCGPFYREFFQLRGAHCEGSAEVFGAIRL